MIGETIAHYRITAKLGEGGMGAVYRATDTKLNREVAIKVLPPAFAEDTARMQRFEREAQVLASLNHPNIAAIYGIERSAIVMELVEGNDLKGPVPVETALAYARQIAIALEAAHEKGIVHRDLKPANIKVTPEGVVKVLDFGLAKAGEGSAPSTSVSPTMSPTLSLAMTQAGMILGTAAYMAPEQARGKPVDKRADIWAFGVVLYELLTGRQLFASGDTVTDTIAAVVMREPDWNALPADTPVHIRRIMERCLRKDPKQRLRDIGEARIALEEPVEAPAPVPSAPPQTRRSLLPWAVAAAMTLAALALSTKWFGGKTVEFGAARYFFTLPEGTGEAGSPATPQVVPSPDGRTVAFIARDTKMAIEYLWVRPLGSLSAQRLDRTDGAAYPFWSPDSQFIAFFADQRLKRIAVGGGAPQTVCDVPEGGRSRVAGDGGSWNRDGVIVFGVGQNSPLMRVAAAGGIARPATKLDTARQETRHGWPQFLPDGKHILYHAVAVDGKGWIYVQELGSTQRVPVLENLTRGAWAPPGYLLFVREGALFAQRMNSKTFQLQDEPVPVAQEVTANEGRGRSAFALSGNGVLVYRGGNLNVERQIAWYRRDGKRLETIGQPGRYESISLSPDEKSVAILGGTPGRHELSVMDLATGVLSRMILDPPISGDLGDWSPDSRRIAFDIEGGGIGEVTVASGRTAVLSRESLHAETWSPDGRLLLGTDARYRRLWIWAINPDGSAAEAKPRVVLDSPDDKRSPRFSPDGQWVAYYSFTTRQGSLMVARFPSFSEMRQVSKGAGFVPLWRKDGKELFYIADDSTLMSVEIQLGAKIEAAIPKPLFKAVYAAGFRLYAVAGDGQRFLLAEAQKNEEPKVIVVLNWAADLKP